MFVKEAVEKSEQLIVRNLQTVGEYAIGFARDWGLYTDRTGNLRSSVGYIIAKNGKEIFKAGFDAAANSGTEGETGAREGYKYALELVKNHSGKYALIFVAGMFYAEYVEKAGYDVLIGTEIEAKEFARQLFSQISKQAKG